MPQPAWVAGRLRAEPFLSRFVYSNLFKRSSTYMTVVMITATTTGASPIHSVVGRARFRHTMVLIITHARPIARPRRHLLRLRD